MRVTIALLGFAGALLAALPRVAAADDVLQCPAGAIGLSAALAQAAQANPAIVQARDNLDAAAAGRQVAAERPNPTLNAGITQWDPRARSRGDGGFYSQPLYASVQLQQLIERGGKRDARRAAADAGASAADADFADTQRRVAAAVRGAYYALKFADARVETLQGITDLQAQTLAAADRRLQVGDLSKADRARIALEVLKASNEQQQAQADAAAARLALGSLLGCHAPEDLQAADDWLADAMPPPPAGARADEIADQQRLHAAEAGLQLAQAQTHRDLTVGVEWDHDPRQAPNMAGVTVGVPLFLAHRYEGEIAQARAQVAAARDNAAQTALTADTERDGTRAALLAAQGRRDRAINEVLPQAEATADAVEYAYTHGAAPLLDLLDSRRALRAARLDALSAQLDFAVAAAARDAALAPYQASSQTSSLATSQRSSP